MAKKRVLVWDWPTRLFHWALVISVTASIVTIKLGGDWMDMHAYSGYTAVGLLVFRVIWGLVGSHHSRFKSFFPTPRAIWLYLRGRGPRYDGHNPLGALSVFAMLASLIFQAVSGLFTNDDIFFEGPLAKYISSDLASTLTGLHRANEWVLYVLLGLHIAAILFYTVAKRQKLIPAMLHGHKTLNEDSHMPG
jgi:cytochrome b